MYMNELHFNPHPLVKNPHLQTLIGAGSRTRPGGMVTVGQKKLLEVEADGNKVRLKGVYSPQPEEKRQGLVLLLHGWLGSIEATYMLGRGEFLFAHGYSIFRLNMRDHGGTVALNEGLFHGCRLEEVFQATRQIAALEPDSPFFVIGFSMGGNFALRVAWRHSQDPIANLRHVIALSPSVNPAQATRAIDNRPTYLHYFRHKWRTNLKAKQAAFPELYDFSHILRLKTCWALGEAMVDEYSDFPDVATYYNTYAFTPDKLRPINIPITIVTAADDPIIPAADFKAFVGVNRLASVIIQPYGGHLGFIDIFPFHYWLNEAILKLLTGKL